MRKRNSIAPLIAAFSLFCNQTSAFAAPPPIDAISTAQVTEARGDIFKRGFVDWNREVWGEPTHAQVGDKLEEGMQLGTGEKSWAQLTWKHITTRAWEKSVYAIAPNQRLVYLIGGELLFQLDKNRKDKQEYYVWTNLLQARIRGTTVMVQSTGTNSRISVLEGSIDVENRSDHSIVHLKPGVVMEVQSKGPAAGCAQSGGVEAVLGKTYAAAGSTNSGNLLSKASAATSNFSTANSSVGATSSTASSPSSISSGSLTNSVSGVTDNLTNVVGGVTNSLSSTPKSVDNVLSTVGGITNTVGNITNPVSEVTNSVGKITTTMISTGDSRITVFETAKTITTLYSADPKNLMSSPLVTEFPTPLPSVSLIQQALTDPTVSKPIANNAQIVRVPVLMSYNIGPTVGTVLPLPESVGNWPPTAVIGPTTAKTAAANAPSVLTGSLKAIAAGNNGNKYNPENPLTQLPVSDVLLGPQLPGGIAPVSSAVIAANQFLSDPLGLANNAILKATLGLNLTAVIGATSQTPVVGALVPPATAVPPITVPPVTVPPIGLPPITVPPITIPPIGSPPITVPPITVPPITVPPITVPPITVPPITVPPITVPPISLPPITVPPVTVPPVKVPPITVPPIVTVPPVTVPPITVPPITVPPVTVPPVTTPPITLSNVTVQSVTTQAVTPTMPQLQMINFRSFNSSGMGRIGR